MTSRSCSFQETRKILQMRCKACSSETSELDEESFSARFLLSLRSLSSTSIFSIPESTSTWDMLFSQEAVSMSMLWERDRDWDCVSRLLDGELERELTPSLLWLR